MPTVNIRLDEKTKYALMDAALGRGTTLSAFMIDAALSAANEKPTLVDFCQATLDAAHRGGRALGGRHSYRRAGYEITLAVLRSLPKVRQAKRRKALNEILDARTYWDVRGWFPEDVRVCLPQHRSRAWRHFLGGVERAVGKESK